MTLFYDGQPGPERREALNKMNEDFEASYAHVDAVAAHVDAAATQVDADAAASALALAQSIAIADALGPYVIRETKEAADEAFDDTPVGIVYVLKDETYENCRTWYKKDVGATALEFVVNLDQLRVDLSKEDGSEKIGYKATTVGEKLIDIVSPTEFGASPGNDASSAIIDAFAESPRGVFLPPGEWPVDRADSRLFLGVGETAPYVGAPRTTAPAHRKTDVNGWRTTIPFEDEHLPHASIDGQELFYTAFGGACSINGVELYVARTSYEHTNNTAHPNLVHLYGFCKNRKPIITKRVIYTAPSGTSVLNVNICPHPGRNGIALITFGIVSAGAVYSCVLITYNAATQSIESERTIGGLPSNEFKWGNALVTPQGYLIFCSYKLDGTAINVWRSTVALPVIGAVDVALASTISDTVASEPTIGYWNNRIVCFYRRTGAASRLTYTWDVEGQGPWADPVFPYGVPAHSPAVIPYSNASVFTAFFSLGTDRTKNGFVSSNDLVNFKGSTPWQITGNSIGGYPSIIDLGGSYSSSTYAEHYDKPRELKRTRFERVELDKGLIDVSPADPQFCVYLPMLNEIPNGLTGVWIGSLNGADSRIASDARGYKIEFEVKRHTPFKSIALLCAAGSSSAYVQILDGTSVVLTSDIKNINASGATPSEFSFSSEYTLHPMKKYTAVLFGSNAIALFSINHNRRRKTLLDSDRLLISGASNQTTSLSGTNLIPVSIRVG